MNTSLTRTGLLVATTALVTATAPVHAATASPVVRWTAQGCVESVVSISIPIEVAQRQLPAPYRAQPFGLLGRGSLYVGVAQCRALQVAGVEQPSDVVSDVSIAIEPMPGLTASSYHLWQVVGSQSLRDRLARLGLPGAAVPGTTASVTLTPAVQLASGNVPWAGGSDYTVDVVGAYRVVSSGGTRTWVHQGARGRIRTEYRFGPSVVHSGGGTVRTSPGTRMFALLGGEARPTTNVTGFVIEPMDIEARVYLDR